MEHSTLEKRGSGNSGSGSAAEHLRRRNSPKSRCSSRALPEEHRFELSKRICKELGWIQPNGRLKDRSCRDVLARLDEIGFIRLPRPRRPAVRRRPVEITERSAPRPLAAFGPRDIEAASFRIVSGTGNLDQERLWNEYVERYHYLGYGVPVGPHIKYFVTLAGEPIACLCFAGAAWRVEARDRWIGWNCQERERNLCYILNNTRFVIFPWVNVRNLASRLLALAAKRIAADWQRLYAYQPLLLESFVDSERYTGACYRAANWILVGLYERPRQTGSRVQGPFVQEGCPALPTDKRCNKIPARLRNTAAVIRPCGANRRQLLAWWAKLVHRISGSGSDEGRLGES